MGMTKTFPRGRAIAVLIAGTLIFPFASHGSVSAVDWTPKEPPSIYSQTAGPNAVRRVDYISDVCASASDLDCVESIAAEIGGVWVEGTSTSSFDGPSRLWEIPGVLNLNGSTQVSVTHKVNYTGNLFLQTQINAAPIPSRSGYLDENSLPRGVKFRATVRTSWVLPTHVSGKSSDTKVSVEKLATSGASRITMEGIPIVHMIVLDQTTLTSATGKGASDARHLGMTVSDGRFYPVKKDCIEKPTLMTSDNSYGHPIPTVSNGNLDLKLQSPHFRSDGVTEHVGIYEARIPLEMATCLWGESITSNSEFALSVFESGGQEKSATSSIVVTDEAVVIKASGFTFSSPTVRITYKSKTPLKPSGARVSVSKKAITVSFTKVSGTSYAAIATKGKLKKTLKCTTGKTRVTCAASRFTAGKWVVTVTPKKNGIKGPTYSRTAVVR